MTQKESKAEVQQEEGRRPTGKPAVGQGRQEVPGDCAVAQEETQRFRL